MDIIEIADRIFIKSITADCKLLKNDDLELIAQVAINSIVCAILYDKAKDNVDKIHETLKENIKNGK